MSNIYYGLTNRQNLLDCIGIACYVIKPDNAHQAREQLIVTACAESGMGTVRDGFEKQGRGWAQKDFIRFHDNMQRLKSKRHARLKEKLDREFDFKWMHFEQLDYSPLLSAVHCRLAYYFVEDPMPEVGDLLAQAKLWKKVYNVNGSGTVEKCITRAKFHYFGGI